MRGSGEPLNSLEEPNPKRRFILVMCFSDGKTEGSTLILYLLRVATLMGRGLKERALDLP